MNSNSIEFREALAKLSESVRASGVSFGPALDEQQETKLSGIEWLKAEQEKDLSVH